MDRLTEKWNSWIGKKVVIQLLDNSKYFGEVIGIQEFSPPEVCLIEVLLESGMKAVFSPSKMIKMEERK